jgi:hypothetical protein
VWHRPHKPICGSVISVLPEHRSGSAPPATPPPVDTGLARPEGSHHLVGNRLAASAGSGSRYGNHHNNNASRHDR